MSGRDTAGAGDAESDRGGASSVPEAPSDRSWGMSAVDRGALRRFALGDALLVLAFVVVGEYQHNADPVEIPFAVLETYATFLLGWALAAPLAGAYADRLRTDRRALLSRTALAWVGAVAVAMALRATPRVRGDAAPTFALVAALFGCLFLLAWRLAASAILD